MQDSGPIGRGSSGGGGSGGGTGCPVQVRGNFLLRRLLYQWMWIRTKLHSEISLMLFLDCPLYAVSDVLSKSLSYSVDSDEVTACIPYGRICSLGT